MSTVMRRRFILKLFDDQNALWTTTCPGISWISHEEYFIDTLFKDVYPDVFERDSSSTAAMMDLPSCTDVKAHQGVSGFFLFFVFWREPSLDRFDRNCNRLKLEFKNTTRERERERERERDASLDYRAPGNLRSACQFQPWSRSLRAAIRPNGIIKLAHPSPSSPSLSLSEPLRVREGGTWSFRTRAELNRAICKCFD